MDAPTPPIHHGPDLFSKVGPLPAWAWGAIVVGGYIVYQHMHAGPAIPLDNSVETPTAEPSGDFADTGSGSGAVDPASSGYNYNDVLSGSYTGTTTGSGTRYSTNQQWAISVISNLTSMGFSASLVTTAVTKYLSGQALTSQEAQAISAAITDFGPPPLPLPVTSAPAPASPAPKPVTRTPLPVPKPKPIAKPPIAKKRYVVRPGDTLSKIGVKYHLSVSQLMHLNPTIKSANRIFPGMVLRVEL